MKKYFITGLATLIPLALTIWVAVFILDFLTKPFLGLISELVLEKNLPIQANALRYLIEIAILFLLFLSIVFLGMIGRWYFFHALVKLSERIFNRIPLMNKVYKTTKGFIQSLLSDQKNFEQVVMLPFAKDGPYVIGLVSRKAPVTCNKASGEEMVSIFLPTTPNPMTGFLLLRPMSDLMYLKMSPQDAIKYIVSCGATLPPSQKESPL